MSKATILIPGLDLLQHIQPVNTAQDSRIPLVIDFEGRDKLLHAAGKNFTKGEVYGCTLMPYPDNEHLLSTFGYTIQDNPFDYVQYKIKNILGNVNRKVKAVSRVVKCWEETLDYDDIVKQENLFFNIKRDNCPNNRLLNYVR